VITDDPYLIVRAATVYITVALTAIAWAWQRPGRPVVAGAVLGFVWNLPALLVLHVAASAYGWWHFDAQGGLLLGMPVDLYLCWAWVWGAIPALAFPKARLAAVVAAALAFDVVLMPAAGPVLQLGPAWLIGEIAGLLAGLVPAQLLARWTAGATRLDRRAVLQVLAFSGLILVVLPAVAIEGSGTTWINPSERPLWQISVIVQVLAVPAAVGLSAVQEFVTRGAGTPVPFDPPRRLVTSGLYAYVRNPMQLSAAVLLLLWGLVLRNGWVAAAGIMAHLYSTGLAGWNEDDDLGTRFGRRWLEYRSGVRRWIPRVRPWYPADAVPARLFVSATCGICCEVGRWFEVHGARDLLIVPAEHHPSRSVTRITYEAGDGAYSASGVEAIARALEHIHCGWALLGCVLRLPIVRQAAQLLVDASGGEPRRISVQNEKAS
jgi:protein-S-isoprenylcysteine O-methyltransferase Ste14